MFGQLRELRQAIGVSPNEPVAQSSSQLKLQLALQVQANPDMYTDDQLKAILKALDYTTHIAAENFRHSGRPSTSHLIGTASCVMAEGMGADLIIMSLLHTAYMNFWTDELHPFTKPNPSMTFFSHNFLNHWAAYPTHPPTFCETRKLFQDTFGVGAEHALFEFSTLFAHGPHVKSPQVWLQGLSAGIYTDLEKKVLHMSLCDEYEEHFHGEQFWSMWKNTRTEVFHQGMAEIARQLATPGLQAMIEDAVRWTTFAEQHIFSEDFGGGAYRGLRAVRKADKVSSPTPFPRDSHVNHVLAQAQEMGAFVDKVPELFPRIRHDALQICPDLNGGLSVDR